MVKYYLGMRQPAIVSACLFGLRTRYDARLFEIGLVTEFIRNHLLIPVCPEQLGGLSTPRAPAEIVSGDGWAVLSGEARVLNRIGEDVTEAFVRGAEEVLKICRTLGIRRAFLKARSPSCGLSPKVGVTAALLLSEGLEVYELG